MWCWPLSSDGMFLIDFLPAFIQFSSKLNVEHLALNIGHIKISDYGPESYREKTFVCLSTDCPLPSCCRKCVLSPLVYILDMWQKEKLFSYLWTISTGVLCTWVLSSLYPLNHLRTLQFSVGTSFGGHDRYVGNHWFKFSPAEANLDISFISVLAH